MKADGLFEAVKQSVSMRAIAEQYGLEVRHGGMIVCPFHADKNPSMKLNEDYYYCFGCGATGDAIDFVAQLFGIRIRQAAEKIADDFAISYDSRAIHESPRKIATKTQIAKQRELYTARVLSKYFRLLDGWLKEYSPKKPEDEIHPRFMEAVQRKDYVEYLMDVLICVQLKQRQILPGLPETHYPQTGSRAHEKTARSCYAVRAKKALFYRLLTAVFP